MSFNENEIAHLRTVAKRHVLSQTMTLSLLDAVEWLRKENTELALGNELSLAGLRAVADSYKADLAKAVEALRLVKQTLTIPAAEYVPAIPDAWDIIDAVLKELER